MSAKIDLLRKHVLARAQSMPDADTIDLVIAHRVCGSVARRAAECVAAGVSGFCLRDHILELDDTGLDLADRSHQLDQAAHVLRQAGFIGAWRNEQLELRPDPQAPALAQVDRCVVRVLGITTYSVHLNGHTAEGQLVVARRAAHKRVDPGLWDNLAGGIVTAGESVHDALVREAYEEAGLDITSMSLQQGARLRVRRPINEGTLVEFVHVFDVDLPAGLQPSNRDGEVERFETRTIPAVLAAIERGEFTVEAALATLDSLERRGHCQANSGANAA